MVREYIDVYYSTVAIAFFLFLIAIHLKDINSLKLLKWIGKNISSNIYILHLPIIELVENLPIPVNNIGGDYLKPIVVILITVMVASVVAHPIWTTLAPDAIRRK